jgi:hypothetical protein
MLSFDLPYREAIRVAIYDVSGRRVRGLLQEVMPAGTSQALWDRRDDGGRLVASGIYIARLVWPQGSASQRVVLIR